MLVLFLVYHGLVFIMVLVFFWFITGSFGSLHHVLCVCSSRSRSSCHEGYRDQMTFAFESYLRIGSHKEMYQ